jgi:hypothetical protein
LTLQEALLSATLGRARLQHTFGSWVRLRRELGWRALSQLACARVRSGLSRWHAAVRASRGAAAAATQLHLHRQQRRVLAWWCVRVAYRTFVAMSVAVGAAACADRRLKRALASWCERVGERLRLDEALSRWGRAAFRGWRGYCAALRRCVCALRWRYSAAALRGWREAAAEAEAMRRAEAQLLATLGYRALLAWGEWAAQVRLVKPLLRTRLQC